MLRPALVRFQSPHLHGAHGVLADSFSSRLEAKGDSMGTSCERWRGTKWHGMDGVAWQDVPHQEKARMPFHHLSLIEVSESETACLSGTDSCSLLLPARLTASLTPCPPNCLLARLPACPSSRLPACLPASQLPVSDCSQRACLCAMHIVHVAKFKKECKIALWYFTHRL